MVLNQLLGVPPMTSPPAHHGGATLTLRITVCKSRRSVPWAKSSQRKRLGGFHGHGSTQKGLVYKGKTHWNGWFGGVPILGNPHMKRWSWWTNWGHFTCFNVIWHVYLHFKQKLDFSQEKWWLLDPNGKWAHHGIFSGICVCVYIYIYTLHCMILQLGIL